jgi:hypothetical protein
MVFYWRRIDGFGLILLGFAFSLILLPFSLAAGADHGYKNREFRVWPYLEVFALIIKIAFQDP